jgi:hypothetical protein
MGVFGVAIYTRGVMDLWAPGDEKRLPLATTRPGGPALPVSSRVPRPAVGVQRESAEFIVRARGNLNALRRC